MIKNQAKYQPTNLEIMEILLRVLCDQRPKLADALFVHGEISDPPQIGEALLSAAAKVWQAGNCKFIVINGLRTDYSKSKNYSYDGGKSYRRRLIALGVPEKNILSAPPSENTATESESFLRMVKEKKWRTLIIAAAPYHQTRCFLQIVSAMIRLGVQAKIYNITFYNVNWDVWAKKKVITGQNVLGQKDETGPLINMAKGELERIIKYAIPSDKYIPNATVKEALKYLRNRN